jgi:hypothetical protein
MILKLRQLPKLLGIYGPNKDIFPATMSLMHPSAAFAYLATEQHFGQQLRVSDMFRSAVQSLNAMKQKTGVQPPGFSAHNYGFAIDIDVDDCLKRFKLDKRGLDAEMEKNGWFCHRRDSKLASECWHYNYLIDRDTIKLAGKSPGLWSAPVEAQMQSVYGSQMGMTVVQIQEALKSIGLYPHTVDGIAGPLTSQAVMAFQRAWVQPVNGDLNVKLQRLLAYITSTKELS